MSKSTGLSHDSKILIAVAGIASYLDAALLVSTGIALTIWSTQFAVNTWWTGIISTMLSLAVALGSFLGGRLSDRYGRVRVFNLDILFTVLGAGIIALATSFPMLLVGLLIAGLASGADLPTSLAVISERVSHKNYGKAISSTEVFWVFGIILSQAIGFITAGTGTMSPRYMFGWLALVALVNWGIRVFSGAFKNIETNLAAANTDSDATIDSQESTKKVSLKSLFKMPQYLLPMLTLTGFYLFWNIPANTWGSFVNYFLVTVGHQTQAVSTGLGLIANIANVVILYLVYVKLADTKYRYVMMYVGLIISFLAFSLSGIFSEYWLVFAVAYVLYSSVNLFCGESVYKIWSQSFFPTDARASVTGFSYGVVRAITALFSLVTPTIMAKSPQMLMWILVVCVLFNALFGWTATKLIRKYHVKDPVYNSKD